MARTGTVGRGEPTIVALAPVVLAIALLFHPFMTRLPDAQAVAASVTTSTTRWAVVHLLTNVASALVAVAFVAVHARLRDAGEPGPSRWGLSFVVFGSVVYGFLPGLEFAPLAAAETGGDIAAIQTALEQWFIPTLIMSVVTFAIGVFAFARHLAHSRVLSRRTTQTVVMALAVMAAARAVPLGVVQFHVQALASLVALLPLAYAMAQRPDDVIVARRQSSAES